MPILVSNLTKSFGEKRVLNGFTHTFADGTLTALMGASGVGKTTLFRILLGLERADAGTVSGLAGRKISAVFQEDRLFPTLTILQNAEVSGKNGRKWLAQLGLEAEIDTFPASLSGGMRRRVALARALCHDGDVFLLDEPFQGLDAARKQEVMEIFRSLKGQKTILLITHDPLEADFLADELLQFDLPEPS